MEYIHTQVETEQYAEVRVVTLLTYTGDTGESATIEILQAVEMDSRGVGVAGERVVEGLKTADGETTGEERHTGVDQASEEERVAGWRDAGDCSAESCSSISQSMKSSSKLKFKNSKNY